MTKKREIEVHAIARAILEDEEKIRALKLQLMTLKSKNQRRAYEMSKLLTK